MKYLINYLKRAALCCLLIVGSISSVFSYGNAEIKTNIVNIVYNDVTESIDFDIQMKKGDQYINNISQGSWEAMDYRFDLFLETGVAMDGAIDKSWLTVHDVIDIKQDPALYSLIPFDQLPLVPPFESVPAGYTRYGFSMTIRRDYPSTNDLTDSYLTVASISVPVTDVPSTASYIKVRDASHFPLDSPIPILRGFGSFWVTRILTDGEYFVPEKSTFPVEDPTPVCPATAVWTGATDSDWNKPANWVTTTPTGAIPGLCTDVTIPGGLARYPILVTATDAKCNTIYFEMGGEVKGTAFLTYTSAEVDLTLDNTRWYMLAAPLRDMYSGDYFLGESTARRNPSVSMMRYQADNPQFSTVVKEQGKWSNTFNTLDVRLDASSSTAFATRVNLNETAANKAYTFTFPYSETEYEYYDINGVLTGRITSTLTRTNSSKFVYEEASDYNISTGTFSFPIENGMAAGYTNVIVGNPFMAHLDLTEFYTGNSGKLSGTFQIWTGGATETYMYDSFTNQVVSTEDVELGIEKDAIGIHPMQAVFAERKAGETFSALSFAPDMTVIATGPGSQLRTAAASPSEEKLLRVQAIRDRNRESGAMIRYKEGADNGYVQGEDAKAFFISNLQNEPAVIFSAVDGEAVTINTIGDLSRDVPLGISTSITGQLTLDFSGMESFGEREVVLTDVEAGIMQSLSAFPSYTFENTNGNVENRLFVSFVSKMTTGVDDASAANIHLYAQNGLVHIIASETIESVKVTTLLGQCLYLNNSVGSTTIQIPVNTGAQAVLVQVKTANTEKTAKVLVK